MLAKLIDGGELEHYFSGKKALITGGTGSFGNQIVGEIVKLGLKRIVVLSRDEEKQYHMQNAYKGEGNLDFALGDVRDLERVREAMRGIDVVFHAAALKQVPNSENAPFEAVKTNIIGAENVRKAAIEAGVQVVVAISTDKAVKPVNVMGMSKAIQERIMLHPNNVANDVTRFVCVRYGNVLGSRGSVVPLFRQKIKDGLPLPITHVEMTRFLLTLSTAVQLVFKALLDGKSGELWVHKMPAARVIDLARILAYGVTGRADYPLEMVGVRPGEKIHEILVSEEEMMRAVEMDQYFLIRPWTETRPADLSKQAQLQEYASNNVQRLTDDELYALLDSEGWFAQNGE